MHSSHKEDEPMTLRRNADVKAVAVRTVEGQSMVGEARMKAMMAGEQMTMLEVEYPAGSRSPTHVHQHESLCYVLRGRIRTTVGDASYTMQRGDACRHPEGVPHSVEALEDATILEIKSPPQPLEEFLGTSM